MEQDDVIEFAVEESIAEAEENSPVDPKAQVELIGDNAATKFNQFVEENGIETSIDSRVVLEAKCEAEAERQLE